MQVENYIFPVAATGQDLEVRASRSFNRYLSCAYCVLGTILAAGNPAGIQKEKKSWFSWTGSHGFMGNKMS